MIAEGTRSKQAFSRAGQTWRLTSLDERGLLTFTVLHSERHNIHEVAHEILVLDVHDFDVFEVYQGRSTWWWESSTWLWEADTMYERVT